MNKRLPYETFGVPLAQRVKLYDKMVSAHWIGTPEQEGEYFQEMLPQFGFLATPKSGWPSLAYELRLIDLNLPERPRTTTKGRAEVAKQCDKLGDDAWKLVLALGDLSGNLEFMSAQFVSGTFVDSDQITSIIGIRAKLETIARHLRSMKQPPKWRQTELRRIRVELACKITPLFEAEFSLSARPVGGSASLELSQTNDWTRFYQAIASALLRETVTPDRQEILWEAARPSE